MGEEKGFVASRERGRDNLYQFGAGGYGGWLWLEVWAYILFILFKHKLSKVLGRPAQCDVPEFSRR